MYLATTAAHEFHSDNLLWPTSLVTSRFKSWLTSENMTLQNNGFERNATLVASLPAKLAFDFGYGQRLSVYDRFFKRVLDLLIVVLAAPIVAPVVVMLAFLVARDGHSPFYRQDRVGRHGRIFSMWKLRTMVPDADRHLAQFLSKDPMARQEWAESQKLKADPRVTNFGRCLRRTSMDELPQLWNVFVGDMSLVGPRPMMTQQQDLYPGNAYYSMRPGLTGYWQISDRNESSFAARANFDTRYFNDMKLSTDIDILSKTVGVVLRGTGY
ncbi:MAG: sugar transferase [Paracoccaceae bacterium]